jgi:hypothetical protein
MEFNSFTWISEIVSFSLQSYCFFLFKQRKSLRLLMLLLCARNIISVATHSFVAVYFYQLYFGRVVTALLALWVVADVACYPDTPKWTLRVPVAFAALLAIPYSPLNPNNGPGELEHYRLFCLALGMFILVMHIVFLAVAHQNAALPMLLLAALGVEAMGSAGMILLGYHPQVQMFCWWVGLVALGSSAVSMRLPPDPLLPSAQVQQSDYVTSTAAAIRLPLQSRLPHSQVFERWKN